MSGTTAGGSAAAVIGGAGLDRLAFLRGAAADQGYLQACFDLLAGRIERLLAGGDDDQAFAADTGRLAALTEAMPEPPALERLRRSFGLGTFELWLLVLCAGWELDGRLAGLMTRWGANGGDGFPCLSLAVRTLLEPHWHACTPGAPLRRWHLLRLEAGGTFAQSRLRLDEHLLHLLKGVAEIAPELQRQVERVASDTPVSDGQRDAARRLLDAWRQAPAPAVVELLGTADDALTVAAHAWNRLRVPAFLVPAAQIPVELVERERFLRIWEREALLGLGAAVIAVEEPADPALIPRLRWLAAHTCFRLVLASERPVLEVRQGSLRIMVPAPTIAERRAALVAGLGDAAGRLREAVDEAAFQFRLPPPALARAAREAVAQAAPGTAAERDDLWRSCVAVATPALDDLAQRIAGSTAWDRLVLPPLPRQALEDLVVQCRQRATVQGAWGLGAGGTVRGGNLTALLSGASGTGKTFAAECLAGRLGLPLYRIDLSSLVSKYIGETEKHLKRVFDGAEGGGAILLFDEADTLFGKRSEVSSSNDRHANIEVGYLLQRLESYTGLALLTTNHRQNLDPAFLRRFRFVIHFPEPGPEERAQIWQRSLPEAERCAHLDLRRLAALELTGGNIRTAAIAAASYAADERGPLRMEHLVRAITGELAKAGRPLPPAWAAANR